MSEVNSRIIEFLDIDTRLKLGIPPRKLKRTDFQLPEWDVMEYTTTIVACHKNVEFRIKPYGPYDVKVTFFNGMDQRIYHIYQGALYIHQWFARDGWHDLIQKWELVSQM